MPADTPQPGEIWQLPNQPSLTTSGQGGEALILEVNDTYAAGQNAVRVILIGRQGRRLTVPMRSFMLSWNFVRTVQPTVCTVEHCSRPAWLRQNFEPGASAVCMEHLAWENPVHFPSEPPQEVPRERCPACDSPGNFPGSGGMVVGDILVTSCGRCRRDWIRLDLPSPTYESSILLTEEIIRSVNIIEDRNLVARVRMGAVTYASVRRVVGTLGDPPHIQGVPVAVGGQNATAVYVIGHQPRDIRGVQRLGGQPDRDSPDLHTPALTPVEPERPFTNTIATVPKSSIQPVKFEPGAIWWNKLSWERAYIIEMGSNKLKEVFVKFRADGAPEIQMLGDFLTYFQEESPPPPCGIGEEWVDSQGVTVIVKVLDQNGAEVENTGGSRYLLPYAQFQRWRKVVRKSIYERLADDLDDSV